MKNESKLSRRGLVLRALAAPMLISGCGQKHVATLGLRHIFRVSLPSGESDLSSVVACRVTYRPEGWPLTNTYLRGVFQGHMPFAPVKKVGLLATTFPSGDSLLSEIAHQFDPGASNSKNARLFFDALPGLMDQRTFDVPRQFWPLTVLFTDRSNPLTAHEVFPNPMAQGPGAEINVLRYRVMFTKAAPSVGLDEQLPWLAQVGKEPIGTFAGEYDPRNALADTLYASRFLRVRDV